MATCSALEAPTIGGQNVDFPINQLSFFSYVFIKTRNTSRDVQETEFLANLDVNDHDYPLVS